MKTLAIVSGGMDSVTLAYWLKSRGRDLSLLSFNYGQRHETELNRAMLAAERLGVEHKIIDIRTVGANLGGSSLTDLSMDVPDGHYAEESMRITVVPNRNAIMLAIAFGVAYAGSFNEVAIGNHAGDHYIYPDCRPAFIDAFNAMQKEAGGEMWQVDLFAPFVNMTKADIVRVGYILDVPFKDTWSCYKGTGIYHCGTCGTCTERKEAFELAGIADPTEYLK